MKNVANIYILLVLLSSAINSSAQLIFNFVPEVYARTIDGLGTFKVQNISATRYEGQVSIMVKESTTGLAVVSILTPVSIFNSGLNSFPRGLFTNSAFKFYSSTLSSIVSQSKNFPPGEYSFCYTFIPVNKQLSEQFENCFDAAIQPLLPINLTLPADHDTICIKRPVLSWQPPMPFNSSMRFRLVLTEKRSKEPIESILKNNPLLLLDNIVTTSINYPLNNPELKEGKTYYWQVVAYQQGLVISTSEIWEFTIQCNEEEKPIPSDSYRELKLLQNGNYYIANRYLKFSFLNNYNISKLQYSIHDLDNKEEALRSVPQINIQPGLNKIDIDLTELNMTPGRHYLLNVIPFNETPIKVRFIYKDE